MIQFNMPWTCGFPLNSAVGNITDRQLIVGAIALSAIVIDDSSWKKCCGYRGTKNGKFAILQVEGEPFVHCGRAMFESIAVKKRNEAKCYGANICLLAWQVEPSILKWSCFQQPGYRLIYSCIKKTCFQTWKCIRSIYSNDGSNFIGVEKELKKAYSEMNDHQTQDRSIIHT